METKKNPVLLVVDDEEAVRYSFRRMMSREPFQLETCSSGQETIERVWKGGVSVVVLDIRLGNEMTGTETLRRIKEFDSKIAVILMTAYASANTAIEATRYGAYDYVLKPFEPETMRTLIHRAYQAHEAMSKAVYFSKEKELPEASEGDCIIGFSPAMQEVYKKIGRIASSSEPVLIRGESGTGKELVARAIYNFSDRKDSIFLPINCGAIPKDLLESEFFGHEKGAFTNAYERRIGKFEQADGGTVFLDEIGEMSLGTQVKLFRFLDEQVVTRVGATTGKRVDVRILAATNRQLENMVQNGQFREELYYRLNVVTIDLPPLTERKEDIPLLVRYFIEKHAKNNGIEPPAVLPETLDALTSYHWPGNVRELENTIRRVLVQCRGHAISPQDLELEDPRCGSRTETGEMGDLLENCLIDLLKKAIQTMSIKGNCVPVLPEIEKILVRESIRLTGGNQVQASKILGMSRNTLRKRLLESVEDCEDME